MRNNTSGNRMLLQFLYIQSTYSGAINTTTPSSFIVCRFDSATASGGSALTVVPVDTNYPASNVLDARMGNGGLTTAGISQGGTILPFSCANQANTNTTTQIAGSQFGIIINIGEGVLIKASNTVSTSINLNGFIAWSELP